MSSVLGIQNGSANDVSKIVMLSKSQSDSWIPRGSFWSPVFNLRSKFNSLEYSQKRRSTSTYKHPQREYKYSINNNKDFNKEKVSLDSPQRHESYTFINSSTTSNNSNVELPPKNTFSPNDILSPSDIISPPPSKIYLTNALVDKKDFKILKLVEELLQSEDIYVNLLKILLNNYLHPLFYNSKINCGIPLYLFTKVIEQLLEIHQSFLSKLNVSARVTRGESVVSKSITISELINFLMENHYLYVEYCDVYEDVLVLSKTIPNNLGINQVYVGGLRGYLEATQPPFRKLDLSFMSLIQRPTTRYCKYRLFLESLVKWVPAVKYEQENITLIKTLKNVKVTLETVNQAAKKIKDSDKSGLIKELIDFESCQLGSEYFGKVLLVGSLVAFWVEIDKIQTCTFAALAFKSHLVLSDLKRNRQCNIKFIIPLSKSNLIEDTKECEGGLTSGYPYSFKLLFERKTNQYEIFFAAIQLKELQIWRDLLRVLINVVNGPYKMDFSKSCGELSLVDEIPDEISPYNCFLNETKINSKCYFKRPICIKIFNFIYGDEGNNLLAEYQNTEQLHNYQESFELTRHDRIKAEKRIGLLWSKELPRLIFERKSILSKHWSFLNFQSVRYREPEIQLLSFAEDDLETQVSRVLQPLLQFSFKDTKELASIQEATLIDEPMHTARTHISLKRALTRVSRASSIKSNIMKLFKSPSDVSKSSDSVRG